MYKPEVINTVKRNFYVDDCLKSVSSDEKAIELAADLQSLLRRGGFRLTKWLSNKRDVVESIPESERAPSIMNLSKSDSLPVDRALGVQWNVEKDELKFKVKVSEKPITRRGILSIVSSIFDPLGLVAPVTLRAKAIVQNLCRQKLSWDDPIPEKDTYEWKQWLDTLPYLESVSVRRCFKPQDFGTLKNVQLHVFCDSSQLGYGACVYLRLKDEKNLISCSLVAGKSRLAPIKQTSIPRLELSGAVVASRLYTLVADELEIDIDSVTFWTDSMIILGYIKNETRRFKTFVGNRVSEIHDVTSRDQWRHVDTASNPADVASRGMHASDFKTMKFWMHGPEFLQKDESHWPSHLTKPELDDDDTELKKEVVVNTTSAVETIQSIIDRYSSWTKLRRAVAWLLRYKAYCRRKHLNHTLGLSEGDLSTNELNMAEHTILALVQRTSFTDERICLQNGNSVRKDSCLASLNPIIHHDLIRVQGRLQCEYPSKYPVVLPSKHHVTKLIIKHIHEHNGHVGKEHVLSMSREKYWILHGPSAVKSILRGCIPCRRQHTPLMTQQMAPLLDEQTTPDMPPFSHIGIDYFGPFIVKTARAREKRYGCIFTCLTSRAVHFEIAHSLSTDSFISAFQRFQSRR
ncbi:uncharacterized protein LOC128558076 [Mercenaria mercenaria]|uniref:uncharacterized protein LOC128558076 n=1 Tax=Mercenaria mercenaria TaxID=6596 RepID=UPI00234EEB65|nr:uncharacterized protein LOC128558076 [Mercenaria mercenaria]